MRQVAARVVRRTATEFDVPRLARGQLDLHRRRSAHRAVPAEERSLGREPDVHPARPIPAVLEMDLHDRRASRADLFGIDRRRHLDSGALEETRFGKLATQHVGHGVGQAVVAK